MEEKERRKGGGEREGKIGAERKERREGEGGERKWSLGAAGALEAHRGRKEDGGRGGGKEGEKEGEGGAEGARSLRRDKGKARKKEGEGLRTVGALSHARSPAFRIGRHLLPHFASCAPRCSTAYQLATLLECNSVLKIKRY